jgi:nitrite reductase/ring-hydroxylating ferredoxin subunit
MTSFKSGNETTAGQNVMATEGGAWQFLSGLHPHDTNYPARTSLGGQGIVIFRTKNGFRGVQRNCPHMQATMFQAFLISDDTMVRCALHAFTFRLTDGKGVNCPGFRVKVYEIKEENGALYGREVL